MPATSSEFIERLTWEGVIDAPTGLTIWIAIAFGAAWTLWRERENVGRGWAMVFWIGRCAVFGCALWMLAGPTQERVQRTRTAQTIAIFADRSDSMSVVDPPEPIDSLRLSLATEPEASKSPVAISDRLTVALGLALADCERFAVELKERRPTTRLAASLEAVEAAAKRALNHAESLVEVTDEDASLSQRAARITRIIRGIVDDALVPLRKSLEASNHAGHGIAAGHEQMVEGLAAARRRSQAIAADLTSQVTGTAANDPAVNQMTRREKAARMLDQLEESLNERNDELLVDRYIFDSTTIPVAAGAGWLNALAAKEIGAWSTPDDATSDAAVNGGVQNATGSSATNLASVFQQLNAQSGDQNVRLAILYSDGRHNEPNAVAPQDLAAQLVNLPVYVVPIGNSAIHRDVLLHRVEAPSAITEKDTAVIDVIATGMDCDGQSTTVILRHEGREIDRKPIEFSRSRGDCRVRFMFPAKEPGWQELVVEVEPMEDEENASNNFQPVSFEVVRDKIRLLLSDGVARWEYRYLNHLFRRDEHVECDELVFFPRVHGTGALAQRPEFPREVDAWTRYDVVILGDVNPQQLPETSQRALIDFVRNRGGKVIVVAGQNYMPSAFARQPLMEILPVERSTSVFPQQGHLLRLTEEGRLNSALLIDDSAADSLETWRSIYERFPVYGLSEYSQPTTAARTLIEAVADGGGRITADDGRKTNAFLCWQRVGAGRVAYLAAPDTYRLRWRRGDRMHHRFWGQLLRWITAADAGTGGEIVRLQTDRARYNAGDPVAVTAWLRDPNGRALAGEALSVEARTFSGETTAVDLTADAEAAGRYHGVFRGLGAGAYKISVRGSVIDKLTPTAEDAGDSQATITISPVDSVEMVNTQCNRALLEQIAQITGGQVIPPTAVSEVLELASFTPEVSERIERTPLWNRWSSLLIILGCLFTEWVVRKSKGLV